MSDARDAVLGRLRDALGASDAEVEARRRTATARINARTPGTVPARGDLPLAERLALFTTQAEAVQTVVRRVAGMDAVPHAVAALLREHNLPGQVVMAEDPALAGADWDGTMLEIRRGAARESDPVGVTTAFAGIAETGTLMLHSGAETPTLLAYLPESVVVVLPAARMLRAYEDGLRLLREERGELPRSVNFVTGPSRTGDIELTLQLGAHGPKRLFVLLVGGPEAG